MFVLHTAISKNINDLEWSMWDLPLLTLPLGLNQGKTTLKKTTK